MAKRQKPETGPSQPSRNPTLAELIRDEIRAAVRSLLGVDSPEADADADDPDGALDPGATVDSVTDQAVADDEIIAPRRTRRRKGTAKIAYHLAVRKNAATGDLIPTVQIVWLYLKEHGPQTAKEIARATGLPKKTVESSVWKLRHLKLIKGQPIKGQK